MPILSALGAGFGSDKWNPQFNPGAKKFVKPLTGFGVDTINALRTGAEDFAKTWDAGLPKQQALLGEQEGVIRGLLSKNQNADPLGLLRQVGETAMGWIKPSVIDPLARYDANAADILSRVRGISPDAADTTAARLRDARVASGRYYDTAKTFASMLPNLYNQVFNAGITNDANVAGYIPSIMDAYRALDRSGLVPLQTRSDLLTSGAGDVNAINNAIKSGIFGYAKDRNIFDRLGAMDSSMWNSLKDAVNMAMSVYGGLSGVGALGGGMKGGLGGGGGGGASSGGGGGSAPAPTFIPAPAPASSPATFSPGYFSPYSYPPQSPVVPYGVPQYPQYPVTFG